ncbi:MAG: OmpP1/FadL family transporter [Alphaproteobacteria bacterium]
MTQNIKHKLLLAAASGALVFGMAGHATAAGFYIQGQSISHMGSGFAGSASNPGDASTIFFNPAGMTHLDGAQINIGLNGLMTHTDVEDQGSTVNNVALAAAGFATGDGGNPGGLNVIPSLYIATPFMNDNRLWLGLGVNSPFGLGNQYDSDFFGRFVSSKTDLRTIDITPTIAYQATDWLSVGAGLIYQKARGNLQQNVGSVASPSEVRLRGDDAAFGYNLGILMQPWQGTKIGVNYRSETNIEFENGVFQANNLAFPAFAEITLPDIATFGITQSIAPDWRIMGQASYFNWADFDRLTVTRDTVTAPLADVNFNYQDTWNFNAGVEYDYSDKLVLRAGYQFDETPTTIEGRSTVNPDGDRHWFTLGATYDYNEKMSFDFAAAYLDIEDEKIDQTRTAGGNTLRLVGEATDTYAGYVGFGFNYKF